MLLYQSLQLFHVLFCEDDNAAHALEQLSCPNSMARVSGVPLAPLQRGAGERDCPRLREGAGGAAGSSRLGTEAKVKRIGVRRRCTDQVFALKG